MTIASMFVPELYIRMRTRNVHVLSVLFLLTVACLLVQTNGRRNRRRVEGYASKLDDAFSHESRLIGKIMRHHTTPWARPVKDSSQPINVSLAFHLMQILSVDDSLQIITISGWLTALWRDDNISWNPHEFAGLEFILVPSDKVWVPDIGHTNSADGIFDLSHNNKDRIKIRHDGTVFWSPGGIFKAACRLRMTYFPFDYQNCTLSFESWEYNIQQLRLEAHLPEVIRASAVPNDQWEIIGTSVTTKVFKASEILGVWSGINVQFRLKRKSQYFVMNVIVPCVLISVLVLMVFYLPPEAQEKTTLGITVLVAFSVFQLLIAEIMPKSSDEIPPMLVIYFTLFMTMSTTSTILSVCVLNITHKGGSTELPKWLRIFTVRYFARVLFARNVVQPIEENMSKQADASEIRHRRLDEIELSSISRTTINTCVTENDVIITSSRSTIPPLGSRIQRSPSFKVTNMCKQNGVYANIESCVPGRAVMTRKTLSQQQQEAEVIAIRPASSHDRNANPTDVRDLRYVEYTLERILDEINVVVQKRYDLMEKEIISNEWMILANLVDRFLMIIYCLINVIGTSFLFINASEGGT